MADIFLSTKIAFELRDASGEERNYRSVRSLYGLFKSEQAFSKDKVTRIPKMRYSTISTSTSIVNSTL
jgi:hypothetical protein